MVQISDILGYCDARLQPEAFSDYCPNGLQVAGERAVRHLVSGVTASRAFLEAAIEHDADAVLVHHGYFWKGEDPRVVGMKAQRLRLLLVSGVSLLAYHLPLDAHPELGNNAELGRRLGMVQASGGPAGGVDGLLWRGRLGEAMPAQDFARHIASALGRRPVHVEAAPARISSVAWCTGAGQRFLGEAAALGVDAYISGEISEPTAHEARELGVHYFAAGHHATERDGVRALGEAVAGRFGISHSFLDVDNPA